MGRLPFLLWLRGCQGALAGLSVTAHLQIKVILNDAVHRDAIGEQTRASRAPWPAHVRHIFTLYSATVPELCMESLSSAELPCALIYSVLDWRSGKVAGGKEQEGMAFL